MLKRAMFHTFGNSATTADLSPRFSLVQGSLDQP